MRNVSFEDKALAWTLGRYPISSAVFNIFLFVSSLIRPFLISALFTVETDTPNLSAIIFIVVLGRSSPPFCGNVISN